MMRSRFEDARMGHKILTSNIDGIKSHFRTSYSLTVKLLEQKTIDECKQLIERGFELIYCSRDWYGRQRKVTTQR